MTDIMKRQSLKAGVQHAAKAACAGLAVSAFPTIWAKTAKYHATMVTSWPGILEGFWTPIDEFCKVVSDLSDGEFVIEAVKPGELVGGLEVYDATSSGAAQMGSTASYYYIGKSPVHGLFTTIPYGMGQFEAQAWMLKDETKAMYDDFLKRDNLVWFPHFGTGTQMGGWFRKPINSVADMKGLKMRIPGMGGKAMSKIGVNVQVLAGGEIFPALERGAIDATEWVGPADDIKFGFNKVAPFYYYPGWHEPGGAISCYVNKDFFETLPDRYKMLLQQVTRSTMLTGTSNYIRLNAVALEKIKADKKVTIAEFPMDVQKALLAASREVMNEYVNQDKDFARMYEMYKRDMHAYRSHLSISDYAYACSSIKLNESL